MRIPFGIRRQTTNSALVNDLVRAAVHYRRLAATQTERADDLEADDARGKQAAWEAGREAAGQALTAWLWRRIPCIAEQNRIAEEWNALVALAAARARKARLEGLATSARCRRAVSIDTPHSAATAANVDP